METRQTLKDFIARHGVTMTAVPHLHGPEGQHWKCQLRSEGRRMTVADFTMGSGRGGRAPTCEEVLNCLAMDAAGVENSRSFEEWAGEYGYDADSRKAEAIYKACQSQTRKLKQFMSTHFEALVWRTEGL